MQAISFHLDTPQQRKIHVTASIGVYMVSPSVTLSDAVERSDEAMYQAKENGRARFCIM